MRLKNHPFHTFSFFLIFAFFSFKGSEGGYHERRLLDHLLDNYNPLERPVAVESDILNVTFGLTLQQIIDVDEKNQILTTNAWLNLDEKNEILIANLWLSMEWTDENFKWNSSDYGNVKDLRITPHRIWRPDILMYNSADEKFDGTFHTNVVVRENGTCLYVPPGIFKSTCKIDITWFPFDDQHCQLKFGSWTYDGFQLDLFLKTEEGGDLTNFITNGEWYLLGMPGKKNVVVYACCPEPYIDITFVVQIRRRTLYYFFNLIVPCVLISSMALLGFTLPPDSGEKLTLGVTILLSLTVFLNLVAETLPQVSDAIPLLGVTILLSQTVYLLRMAQVLPQSSDAIPILGTYFNCIMFMVASSVVLTVTVLNYHHRTADNYRMSKFVRAILLQWMPWILRMSRPGRKITLKTIAVSNRIKKQLEMKERSSKSLLANVLDMEDDFRHTHHAAASSLGVDGGSRNSFLRHRDVSSAATLTLDTMMMSASMHHQNGCRGVSGGGGGGPGSGLNVINADDLSTPGGGTCSLAQRELLLILKEVQFITNRMRKKDEESEVVNDWKFAAMVIDRFCLIVFTLFTILATLVVLMSAPHIIVQ